MDIPIRIRGEMAAILCLEHTGPRRNWEADEESFALAVAGLAALAAVPGSRVWASVKATEVTVIPAGTR